MFLGQDLMEKLYTLIKAVLLPYRFFAVFAWFLIMSSAFFDTYVRIGYLIALAYDLRLI